MARVEQLNRILRSLRSTSPDVEASALISDDGLIIASELPQQIDEARVAGMSAVLLSLGTRAATELERGRVEEVLIRGSDGYAVMVDAGNGSLLLVLANKTAKLGLIFLDVRRAVQEIKTAL
ncbi:MAG: roadblock/LC7 domain-containing protein [Deltaproteobacteria bacterium]|nr:roadblock/LC7 domain-containing protein [Deltaproteobacteria bacterium]